MERGVHRLQVRMAKAIDVVAGVREGVLKGLSRKMGNYHVRFLAGAAPANGRRLLGEWASRSCFSLCVHTKSSVTFPKSSLQIRSLQATIIP